MSRRKQDVFEELLLEVRRSQNATDRFDQAVADAIGVNRTDMRCLDIVEMEGSVTAGRLAQLSGLTTGAITTVIDRLEHRGLARRVRGAARGPGGAGGGPPPPAGRPSSRWRLRCGRVPPTTTVRRWPWPSGCT